MKKNYVKLVSVMMAVVMLLSLTGCGKTESGKTETEVTQKAEPTGTVTESAPTEKPKVTLTIMSNNFSQFKSPGVQSDAIAKELEEKTGVTLEWILASGDDYYNKVAALAASGDLPDIIGINTSKNDQLREILLNSDATLDLTELLKTNGENFTNDASMRFATNYARKFYSNNTDKQYQLQLFVGNQTNPSQPLVSNFIRWDYYKELGYPKINSLDEFLDVMEQMQNAHPTAENGKKAYAFSMWMDWGTWPLAVSGFQEGLSGNNLMAVDNKNYEIAPSLDADGYAWKYLQFWNRAKQRGLLDPDALTQGYSQWNEKLKAGQIYWMQPNWELATYAPDPSKGFAPVDISGGASDSYIFNFITSQGQDGYAINKNCKYPDRAMDFLNYCASYEGTRLLLNGVEGQTWDIVDGKPLFREEVYNEVSKDSAAAQKYGLGMYDHLAGYAMAVIDPEYNVPFRYQMADYFMNEHLKEIDLDCATFYNVALPGQQFSKRTYNSYDNAYGDSLAPATGELKEIEDTLNKYITDNWAKIIISENDAEFEKNKAKFIEDINNLGYQEVIEAQKEAWSKCKAEVDELRK